LDSLQTANLPNIGEFITANEVNLCLHIQTFQECVHSQSYSYMLDTICSPEQRNDILYQWKTDEHLLAEKHVHRQPLQRVPGKEDAQALLRVMMANFILEGVYFYSGFMFFYNLARNGKMPGSAQEIRYINRDENTHLWLFRNMILELQREEPELFSPKAVDDLQQMLEEGVRAGGRVGPVRDWRRDSRPHGEAGERLHPLPGQPSLELAGHGAALPGVCRGATDMAWVSAVQQRQHGEDRLLRGVLHRVRESQRPWWTTCRGADDCGAPPRGRASRRPGRADAPLPRTTALLADTHSYPNL
jgi:ribonucleoside-diphosphate reductase beta chain